VFVHPSRLLDLDRLSRHLRPEADPDSSGSFANRHAGSYGESGRSSDACPGTDACSDA